MANHHPFARLFAGLFITVLMVTRALAQQTCEAPTADQLTALNEACSASAVDTVCTQTGVTTPLDQSTASTQPQVIRLGGDLTLTLVDSHMTALVTTDTPRAEPPIVDQDASAASGYTVTLERAQSPCADSQAGAFISADGTTKQRLTLNQVPVAITDGALFITLEESSVTFFALAGSTTLGSADNLLTLAAGDVILWGDEPTIPDPLPPFPALDLMQALAIEPDECLVDPLVPCDALDDTNALVTTVVNGAGLPPQQVIFNYLSARTVSDAAQMQALSCARWDSQAMLQSQSFRAMRAELLDVACYAVSQTETDAAVACDGVIQTDYNGVLREWQLPAYALTQEDGEWLVCGETR